MSTLTATSTRKAVLALTSALISVVLAWCLSSGVSPLRLGVAAAVTLPLIAFLPALARDRRRAFAALTLCMVAYLVGALTELVANPSVRIWAAMTLILAFALFVAAIVYLRLTRNRESDA